MRRCRPVSLSRTQVALRSFQLVPSTVDFGPLAEGSSASVTVRMKNVGVDLCRYEQQTQVTCGSGSDRRPSVFRKVPSEAASGEDGPASGVQPRPGRPRPAPPRPGPALLSGGPLVLTCECVSVQVPAGLHVDLQLQLLATAAGAAGAPPTRFHHDLVIQTELEILHLPVTANILQSPGVQGGAQNGSRCLGLSLVRL